MQGWMIACIVVAGVILLLALTLLIGSVAAVNVILGRKNGPMKGETPEKYGVDISWFDALDDITETLEITSFDGLKLRALRIKAEPQSDAVNTRVAVLQHGYCASPRSMQPYVKIFREKGYDVVIPAARAHSISEGGYTGMAWYDRFDILRWLDKVVELYGSKVSIALFGQSMGGATVIAACGMNPPAQVKCVIDDCGFSSLRDEYYSQVKKVPLPNSLCVLPLAIGTRLKLGYSISDADFTQFARNMTVPALFIHGTKDTFVPYELGEKLYSSCSSEQKSLEAFDAIHASSYVSDPERYTALVTGFVDKYIKSERYEFDAELADKHIKTEQE